MDSWAGAEAQPDLSTRAKRTIVSILIFNLLTIGVMLAVMIPAGNKAVLYKVQNWPSPWCRPFGCDRG